VYKYEVEYDDGEGYSVVWGTFSTKEEAKIEAEILRKDHPLVWINTVID